MSILVGSTNVMSLIVRISNDRSSLTYYLNILQFSYHVENIQLSISHHYLLAIIYKSVIICKGCYVTITVPTNKDPWLLLYSINIKFHLILFIITHTFLTHVLT